MGGASKRLFTMGVHHPMDASNDNGWFTRDRLRLLVLLAATAITAHLAFRVVEPFMPALTWALALAVVAYPLHERIARRISRADLASAISVALVALILLGPAVLVGQQVFAEGRRILDGRKTEGGASQWREAIQRNPKLAPVLAWIERYIDIDEELNTAANSMKDQIGGTLKSTIWGATQLLVCLFALFFFFRDHGQIMTTLRSLVPLSTREVDEVFGRIGAMVHATIYGTVVVALVQGGLGGLMFWFLGLPAPLLWGVAMALLALIPLLGAFVIWAPAAAWLLMDGEVTKAVLLAVWGTVVVGLIDNLLYPVLVGKEMRLHTLPVFLAIVGGLLVFGASGIVLGPVTLAILLALIDVLRRRTVAGRPAEQPI
jgi:predicted PurR-regulated permease PerM